MCGPNLVPFVYNYLSSKSELKQRLDGSAAVPTSLGLKHCTVLIRCSILDIPKNWYPHFATYWAAAVPAVLDSPECVSAGISGSGGWAAGGTPTGIGGAGVPSASRSDCCEIRVPVGNQSPCAEFEPDQPHTWATEAVHVCD